MSQIIASDLNLEKITKTEDIQNEQCYLYEYRGVEKRLDFIGYFKKPETLLTTTMPGHFIIVWWRQARDPARPNEKLTEWNYNEKLTEWNYFDVSIPSWNNGDKSNMLNLQYNLLYNIDNKNYNDIKFYSLGESLGKFLFNFKDNKRRPNPDFYIGFGSQKKDKKDDDNKKSLIIEDNPAAVAGKLLNDTNIDHSKIVSDGRGGRRKTRVRIKKTRAINKKQKTRKSRRR